MPELTLTVREESMQVLRNDAAQRFLLQLTRELRRHFPAQTAALSRQAAITALAQAGSYGLSTSRDLFRFFSLLFLAGWDGRTSPVLPWLDAILRDTQIATPSLRLTYAWKHLRRQLQIAEANAAARAAFLSGGST